MKKQIKKTFVFIKTYYLDIAFQVGVYLIVYRTLEDCVTHYRNLKGGGTGTYQTCDPDIELIIGVLVISVVLNIAFRKYLINRKQN